MGIFAGSESVEDTVIKVNDVGGFSSLFKLCVKDFPFGKTQIVSTFFGFCF